MLGIKRLRSPQSGLLAELRALRAGAELTWTPSASDLILCESSRWRVVGASVIGAAHEENGLPRQDAIAAATIGDLVIAACADGLSSASYSHVASRFAVDYMVQALTATLQAKGSDWRRIRNCIRSTASTLADLFSAESDGRDEGNSLYTTLIGVVTSEKRGLFFNHGDGAAISFDNANSGKFSSFELSSPEHGPYSGQVYPLIREDFEQHFRISTLSNPDRLLLMTDGVAEFVLDATETGPHVEFITSFDHAVRTVVGHQSAIELGDFLASQRVNEATRDDKSLIWIERKVDGHA